LLGELEGRDIIEAGCGRGFRLENEEPCSTIICFLDHKKGETKKASCRKPVRLAMNTQIHPKIYEPLNVLIRRYSLDEKCTMPMSVKMKQAEEPSLILQIPSSYHN
jgi:hypothetical protein